LKKKETQMLKKGLLGVHACFWLWMGMFSPAFAQSAGTSEAVPQAKSVDRPAVQSPPTEPKIQREQGETQTRTNNLAFLQWRRRVDATTIPKLLRMTNEVRIYQIGSNPNKPLTILNKNSNPHMFHLLKQCSLVARNVPQPISLCYISLYQNGVLLGDLTLFTENGSIGAGRSWTFAPREFMAWLRSRE
jgi:hypothetical protein